MIRLVVSDLVAHARVWLGILAVATAAGLVGGVAAGLLDTGNAYGGLVQEGLSSASGAVIMFTVITALIVLSSTANLTVALQRRSYALWLLVGISPGLVALVVLAQLGLVGAVGALIGCAVAVPVFPVFFAWVFRSWDTMQGVDVHLGAGSICMVSVVIAATAIVGGLRGARRAGRTPPIEALRDPEPPRVAMGWFRVLVTLAVLGTTAGLIANLDPRQPLGAFAGKATLVTPLIAATFAAAGPVFFPLVLRAWTSLVPARASASWFLARNSARYRLSHSTAAIGPLMVAVALTGGLYTLAATLSVAQIARTGTSAGNDLAPEGVVLLLGGPLLLSAVAAAATVFMSGNAREREFALIRAAGTTPAVIVRVAVWEAVVFAVTATLLGLAATVLGGFAIAWALALPVPVVSLPAVGVVAGGGFALILLATVVPTVAALRHEVPRLLAVE